MDNVLSKRQTFSLSRKWRVYSLSIILTLLVGILSGVISMGSMQEYEILNKPALSPAPWVFPIVWTVLFVLMAIGAARVYLKTNEVSWLYVVQLIFNFAWPIAFFNFNAYLFSFIWLIALLVLVISMSVHFYKIDNAAGLLQIPYIIWIVFAGYLNFMIYMLNA